MAWRCPATRCASAAPPPEPPRRNETDQPAVRPANTRRLSGEGRRIPGQRSQPHRRPPSGELARLAAGGQRAERRSEERRVGKECVERVDLGGGRILEKKKTKQKIIQQST